MSARRPTAALASLALVFTLLVAPSTTAYGQTLENEAPSVPRAVKATAGKNRVTLKWRAPASTGGATVTEYTIRSRSRAPGQKWSAWGILQNVSADGKSKFSYRHGKLKPGTKYQYRIAATSAHGTSALTDVVKATVKGAPGVPASFKGKRTKSGYRLTWKPAKKHGAKITSYVVQYHVGGKWRTAATVKGNKRAVTTKAGADASSVAFAVFARNKFGKSARSEPVWFISIGF